MPTVHRNNGTSYDLVSGLTSVNVYTYGGACPDQAPFDPNCPSQVPLEVKVRDQDGSGNTLRSLYQQWQDSYTATGSQTVLDNGQTITELRCYDTNEQITQLYEYGFPSEGGYPGDPSCVSSSGLIAAKGPLRRKTVTAYHNFVGASPSTHIVDEPDSVTIYDGSGTQVKQTSYAYDVGSVVSSGTQTGLVAPTGLRGNPTSVTRWLNSGTSPVTSYTYFDTGKVKSVTDPCGQSGATCSDMTGATHTTTYAYADAFSNGTAPGKTNAYVTQITDALGHISKYKYDLYSGLVTVSQDQNDITANRVGTTYVYDAFSRLQQVNYTDGGQTEVVYNDTAPSPTVTTCQLINGTANTPCSANSPASGWKTSMTTMDGMGHVTQTELASDPDGAVYVNTTYDGMGRVSTQSNPYRPASTLSTDGTTTYTYDVLGRTTDVLRPDGSDIQTSYSGSCAFVTDEVRTFRKSCSDALGRLVEVDEPGAGAQFETAGSANIQILGSEKSQPGTAGSGAITMSNSGAQCVSVGGGNGWAPQYGTISVTINSAVAQYSWSGTCSGSNETLSPSALSTVVAGLAGSINASSAGVTATVNGTKCNGNPNCITLTAKTTGANTNYSVSIAETWGFSTSQGGQGYTACCNGSLSGGTNGGSDTGIVSLTVNGFAASYTWGATDSASSIATNLAGQFSSSLSPVTAQLTGATTFTLTANHKGVASNYSLSSSVQDSAGFSPPSFSISAPSGLTGGSDSTLGAQLVTLYSYDALNNLTCAVQKGTDATTFTSCTAASPTWRPRSFVYDSLSRVTSATNPETGTLTYSYDANGNVSTKASPQVGASSGTGVTTASYTYDNYNRLTKKTYTNPASPTVQFGYDGTAISGCAVAPPSISSPTNRVGRRSAMCSAASASSWSYDPMGHVLAESRKNVGTSAKTLAVNYLYNMDGSLQHIFYPSGRTVNYTVGGAGRITQVDDTYDIFVSSATYTPAGAFATGAKGATNVTNVYNNRQQPILFSATASGASVFSLCYDFHLGQPINTPPCQFSGYTSGNNGNVFQIVDNTSADATNHSVFQYDALNRILQANSAATSGTNCWGEVYTIDSWGNLTNKSGPSGMGGCYTLTMSNPANVQNHLTGLSYDIAGNVLNDSLGNAITYDAESRIVSDAGYTYSYDANGLRMEKANGSAGTMYWPGPNGVVAETDLTGTINEEYIYFNGERIARVDRPSGTVHYYYSDHLGSTRLITDASANVTERYFYDPYGWTLFTSGSDPNHYKFTGKERDTESGLDMFGARYYGSSLGRFMTPDWSSTATAVPYADFGNPQSLNLYSYTKNNPTTLTDPNGHCTKAGQEKSGWWCFWRYSDQDEKRDSDRARAHLSSMSNYLINGQPASVWARTATNAQVIAEQRRVVDALTVGTAGDWVLEHLGFASGGLQAVAVMKTQWGWEGQQAYNDAKNLLNETNTPQGTVDRRDLLGKVPTEREAVKMIEDSGGTVERIEGGHAPGGVSTHENPHINYTTASGAKGTIDIQ